MNAKKLLDEMLLQAERARDETLQWPNSFGHGYNVGRIETIRSIGEQLHEQG